MKISDDTQKILEFLDYTTENNLRKKNDLGTILELAATYNESSAMADILLVASSLWNINRTIKRQSSEDVSIETLIIERKNNIIQMLNLLKTLLGEENSEDLNRFRTIYFSGTEGCERNIIDLAHDLNELNNIRKTIKTQKS